MQQVIKILYIEDDPDDVELLQVSLNNQSIPFSMEVISDGREAINYFTINNNHHDIIILDLNLPKVHGREVLKFIKTESNSRHLPVIILTTSNNEIEMDDAYKKMVLKNTFRSRLPWKPLKKLLIP